MSAWSGLCLFTIGHGTRTQRELFEALASFEVTALVDIRRSPRSSTNAQFDAERLRWPLARAGLRYVHLPALGGLRRARVDSINGAWHSESFRGYADYMQTEEFDLALEDVHALAQARRACLMCAESVPWRCHRSLVADAIVAHGAEVHHILRAGSASEHRLAPFAQVTGEHVTYPGHR